MRHPRKEGHYHAQGHSAGKKDPWREGLVRDYTNCFRFFELQDFIYFPSSHIHPNFPSKEDFDLGNNLAVATYAIPLHCPQRVPIYRDPYGVLGPRRVNSVFSVLKRVPIRVFQDFHLKKRAEPTKHKPGGYIERIQKDF